MLPAEQLALVRRILAETLPAYERVTERDIERAAVAVCAALAPSVSNTSPLRSGGRSVESGDGKHGRTRG